MQQLVRAVGFRRPGAVLALSLWLPGPAVAQEAPSAQGIGLLEAVRMALENDPNLAIEEARLQGARGALLSTRGAFDPVFRTSVGEIETAEPLTETTSQGQSFLSNTAGLEKRFRTGLSIEPQVELLRSQEDAAGAEALNVGTFAFTFRQPLLRGRGREATAAPELSAEREVAATGLDLRQTTSARVLAVVSQYWVTRAVVLDLAVLQETEDRARELLETTRRLIEADVVPAAELVQVEANLAAKESARIGGERTLFEARMDLGREIGLQRERIASLPLPADPFPVVAPESVPAPGAEGSFVAAALARRSDLRAAVERRQGAEILVRAAENALKPQLDLIFTPSYTGLVQGTSAQQFFSPLFRNVPGVSSSFSLNLSWPTQNSQARGERAQIEALREQSARFQELLERQIAADVPAALDAVVRFAQQLRRATDAVRLFERTVENEEKKLRAGTSTLIDLITQRDRLTSARQAEVSTHLSLSLALARLRFETGTLLPEGEPSSVEASRLTSVPLPEAGEATP